MAVQPTPNNTNSNGNPSPPRLTPNITCLEQDFFYSGLNFSTLSPSSYVLVNRTGKDDTWNDKPQDFIDPFGYKPLNNGPKAAEEGTMVAADNAGPPIISGSGIPMLLRTKKLYVKADVDDELVYTDIVNAGLGGGDPRAILTSEGLVNINYYGGNVGGRSRAGDPNFGIVSAACAEDISILLHLNQGDTTYIDAGLMKFLESFIGKLYNVYVFTPDNRPRALQGARGPGFQDGQNGVTGAETLQMPDVAKVTYFDKLKGCVDTYKNIKIHPKAAVPGFAAVPLKSNQFVYGPWVNYPRLMKHQIFSFLDREQSMTAVDNMIGGTKVEVDEDLVPWNYNGMLILDQIASLKLESDARYQQSLETGSINQAGFPIFNLGDELSIVGSMADRTESTTIVPDKSNAGTKIVRTIGGGMTGPTITNIQVQVGSQNTTSYTFRTFTSKLNLYNKKNIDQLKTLSTNSIKMQKDFDRRIKQQQDSIIKRQNLSLGQSALDLLYAKLGTHKDDNPNSPVEVLTGNLYSYKALINNSDKKEIEAHRANVGIYESSELSYELNNGYATKSFMSLDGFFSPVSFYPTQDNATKNFVKYDQRFCPFCHGTKKRNETVDYDSTTGEYAGTKVIKSYCELCEDKTVAQNNRSVGVSESIPPFILASGYRLAIGQTSNNNPQQTIIYEYLTDRNIVQNPKKYMDLFGKSTVDLYNLNPIIVATGEFRNINAGSNDFSGHSIEVVGRGIVPQPISAKVMDDISSGEILFNSSNTDSLFRKLYTWDNQQNKFIPNTNFDKFIPLAYSDIDHLAYNIQRNYGLNDTENPRMYQMNQRFFSLKGPMVLHGWGYDTEGYPVPNASGDYINTTTHKPDIYGRPWRTKDLNTEGSNDPENTNYGDITIGKNQTWNGSSWSKPYKEKEFANSWGQKQNTWPVGPIDLRWDEGRKVWTAAPPNKDVYVVLEEDLVLETNSQTTYPARGFMDDLEFNKNPLPSGFRRIVFVKDYSGYTAPRGAKLYCHYNSYTGFYEPISKQNIICSGVIKQGYNAQIYANYANPSKGRVTDATKINVKFVNNLNFDIRPDHRALFVYMDGVWNLMSIGKP